MVKLENLGKVIETDVLVIGGGISALWAANRAKEFVDRVVIVDKGPRDWGGLASAASGGYIAVLRDENVDDFLEDVVYFYDGICQQDLIQVILQRSIERLEDYQRLGVEFFTNPDGSLWGLLEHGLEHLTLYTASPFPHGGKIMVEALTREADRLGVERLGRILITDLLNDNGRVSGAIGFHTLNGDFYTYKAKAVILASGSPGWKTNFFKNTATGEGVAMALKAGAELSNLEFEGTLIAPKQFAWEGLSNLVPLGGRFINAKGESFMEKYSPFGSNTDDTFIMIAMIHEARAGRGPFYMDCRPIKAKDRVLVTPTHGWMQLNYEKLKSIGMDLLQQKVEWVPVITYMKGSVFADIEGKTSIPGLFVCGRARTFDPTTYLNGSSLPMTAVTGDITGEIAGNYAASCQVSQVYSSEVEEIKDQLFARLGTDGIPPKEILREIQAAIFPAEVCMLKNEASLQKALAKVKHVQDNLLPHMGAKDAHYLMKGIEVEAMTTLSELFLRASLMRKESRAGHYREDYPDRDDKNCLGWIVIDRKDGETNLRFEPLPLKSYRIKPTRFYSDNFNFPS